MAELLHQLAPIQLLRAGWAGGLTLARLLQIKGVRVKVYERDIDRTARVQGGTLDLHTQSGLAALDRAGLMDAFKANYRPGSDRLRVVDEHAEIFFDEHNEETTGDFGDEWFRPEIDRGPLRTILLDSLQPDTVVWDSHIVSLANTDNIWTSWIYDVYTQGVAYSKSGTLDGPWIQEKDPISPPNFGHGMLFLSLDGKLLMAVHSHKSVNGRTVRIPHLFEADLSGDKLVVGKQYKP